MSNEIKNRVSQSSIKTIDLEEFYPKGYEEFWKMSTQQKVDIPEKICASLLDSQHDDLFDAMIVHEKPLTNALGDNFKKILTIQD